MRRIIISLLVVVFLAASYYVLRNLKMQKQTDVPNQGTIQIDQFKLSYKIEGQGEPALVIGNTTYYPRTFSENFKQHLKLYYIDHVGFAQAPAEPIENTRFDIPALIEDIETMRKALGLKKFIIIGHSGHGYLALEYAKKYPQHISHVIMIATAPSLSPTLHTAANEYFEAMASDEQKAFLEQNLKKMPEEMAAYPEKRFIIMLQRLGARSWYNYTFDSAPLWKDVVVNMQAIDHIWGTQFRDIDITQGLAHFNVPVLLVLGKYDFFYPDPAIWDAYKPKFKDLTIHIIDHCGHTPQLEAPEQLDKIVLEWLKEHQ